MVNRLGVVLAIAALTGCGGEAAKKLIPHASCNVSSGGYCMDTNGLAGSSLSDFQSACTGAGGTNSSAACPTTSLMGYCTVSTGLPGVDEILRFYTPAWNGYSAEVECSGQGGTYKDLLPHASCNIPSGGICEDSSGLTGADLTSFQSNCTASSGTNGTAACSTVGRLGSCPLPGQTPGTSIVLRFYTANWTSTSAQSECGAYSGTFVPG